jgi:hypothetical protein
MNPRAALQDLSSLFTEEENKALERATREIAAEKAAWDALPQAERDRILADGEAKLEAMFAATEAEPEESPYCDECGSHLRPDEVELGGVCDDCTGAALDDLGNGDDP